jgi:hypothetical protein
MIPSQAVFAFTLRDWRRSSKYKFYSLWLDPTLGFEPKIYSIRGRYATNQYYKIHAVETEWNISEKIANIKKNYDIVTQEAGDDFFLQPL